MDSLRQHTAAISGTWKLNYYKGESRVLKQAANGWSISPIVTLYSGAPVNVTTGSSPNGDPSTSNRPNLVPGVNPFLDPHRPRTVSRYAWFNKAAFTPNGSGGIGPGGADGTTPRDFLWAPGYRDVDLAVLHDFKFERGTVLQIRADATNVFNMVSLNAPNASLSSSQFGWITSAGTQRLLQLGARFTF